MTTRKSKAKERVAELPEVVPGDSGPLTPLQADFNHLIEAVDNLRAESELLTATVKPLVNPDLFDESEECKEEESKIPPTSSSATGYQNQLRNMSREVERRTRWLAQIRRNFIG
jgi:hypothetical protein